MYIPCFDHCYVKYGKQYDPEICDTECDYAIKCLENKELKAKLLAESACDDNKCVDVDECVLPSNIKFPSQYLAQYLLGEISLEEASDKTTKEVERLIIEYINNKEAF